MEVSSASTTTPAHSRWRWMLVTAIAPIAWGSNYYVTRQFLPLDHPLWGAVLRALPAGILLLALTRSRPRGAWWYKSLVLGTLNVGAFFVLVYAASQLLPSSIASTLMATSAAVLLLLAWPMLGDRPTLLPVVGAVVGFGGVALMLLGGGADVSPLGVAASLCAMVMSSVGFILTKKWAVGQRILSITAWQLLAGGLLVLPAALLVEGGPPPLTATSAVGFVYVTVVATALAFVAWFTGLRHLPAGTVGLIGLLNPVTGVLLGTLLAGELFGPGRLSAPRSCWRACSSASAPAAPRRLARRLPTTAQNDCKPNSSGNAGDCVGSAPSNNRVSRSAPS